MAFDGCSSMSSAARSSHSVVSIGASDPSSPKDLSLPPQEPDRTHALSFCVTCVLTSSHSCAVVLCVRGSRLGLFNSCFPWPRFELGLSSRFSPNEPDRHVPSRRGLVDHPSQCSQRLPVNTISVVTIWRASDHHVAASSMIRPSAHLTDIARSLHLRLHNPVLDWPGPHQLLQ